MNHAALLLLAVLFPAAPDDPPRPAADVEITYTLERLTPDEVARLDGKWARFRVRLDSAAERRGGRDVYRIVVPNRGIDLGTVWLYPGQGADADMVVEARLQAHRYKSGPGAGGTTYPAYTSYRLKEALRVGP